MSCECPVAGYCERYKRQMTGRVHEICRGENIDPAKAAKYRANWARAASGQTPSMIGRAANFIAAEARWIAAGSPMRTEAAVLQIYDQCSGCDQFTPAGEGRAWCKSCGCRLSNQVEPLNKIALATEGCPLAKWSADVASPAEVAGLPCCGIKEDTPVPQVIAWLQQPQAGQHPDGWQHWPNVVRAHTAILSEAAAQEHAYPGGYSGRGIVSCVSAKPGYSSGKVLEHGYFPGAWVMVRELRRLGCTLPITFCHLGPLEWDSTLTELVRPLGVEVIDLKEWNAKQAEPMRILNGWETKVAAIEAAPYEEVLFLDADNLPLREPSYLFDDVRYRQAGAIFWPDVPPSPNEDGSPREWLPPNVWRAAGMEYSNCPAFESGQMLIDKAKCWPELMLARHLNEHSDFWYAPGYSFGDKDTFLLAWRKAAQVGHYEPRYTMPVGPGWNGGALLQHDLDGRLLFEHGCQNKPTINDYPHGQFCLTNPGECHEHLAELRKLWNGRLWSKPDAMDAAVMRTMIGRRYNYRRVGLGERPIRFEKDGKIGLGSDRCETSWSIVGGVLCVSDDAGKPTFFARRDADGTWRGKWEEHERCAVELVPESWLVIPQPPSLELCMAGAS